MPVHFPTFQRGVAHVSQGCRDSASTRQSILGGEAEAMLLSEEKIDTRRNILLAEMYYKSSRT